MRATANRRSLSRLVARAFAAGLVLAAAGCVEVLPGRGEPPKLFTLSPKSTFKEGLPHADWQLVVEVPIAAESLNTSRIAVRHDPLSLQYYKGARWTERAPVMVQTLLVESFENSGSIVAVARKATDLRADFILKSDLREFQAEYVDGATPTVRVRINAKLVRMPERTIIASHTVERRVSARGTSISQIVYAFDAALGKSLRSVVEWALQVPNDS